MKQMGNNKPKTERAGATRITSVSVSTFFLDLMKQHNIKPTEAFRRGIAVMLYDLGIESYQTRLNEERSQQVEEFMKEVEVNEELQKKFDQIEKFKKLDKVFEKIKKLVKSIE